MTVAKRAPRPSPTVGAFTARLRAAVTAALESLADPDPNEAAHRCRVALKRARALARLARAAAPEAAAAFNEKARAAMAALSGPRDDAAMADAARLAGAGARPKAKAVLRAIAERLDQEGAAAAPHALQAIEAPLAALLILAETFPPVTAANLAEGAKALQAKAAKAFKAAHGRAGAERRHAWRKRDKDVQTAAKLLGEETWPGKLRPRAGAALSLALGAERDLLLLEERLAHDPDLAGGPEEAARAARTVRVARRVLGAHADRLGARVYR